MLLGIAEVHHVGAQGEPKRARMPLFTYRRVDNAAWRRAIGDARRFSIEAGFPNLLRLRCIAVQENANRHPQPGQREVETRHALDPLVVVRQPCASRRDGECCCWFLTNRSTASKTDWELVLQVTRNRRRDLPA